MDFERYKSDIVENDWNVYGVEVYENGVLTHSYGDTTEGKYDIYSATKSVLSLAIGIAQDRGLIDTDKCILDYVPESFVSDMSASQKEKFGKITLHRLMTMSVPGFPFRPADDGRSYLKFSLDCADIRPEDASFEYSNIPAYLAGVALAEAVGKDAWEFITEEILDPLGVENAECSRCPDGYFYGASAMKLSVNDLSRIGMIAYNGGTYEGKRIVSEEYVKKATSALQMNREGGYGYFFWKYRDGFSINGKWKQKCYILPKQGIMVTHLADIRDETHDLKESMERNILGI